MVTPVTEQPPGASQTSGAKNKEKFASQGDPEILRLLRKIAVGEGRQFQSVLEEAMRDFITKKNGQKPRPFVIEALAASLRDFDDLYRNLAK